MKKVIITMASSALPGKDCDKPITDKDLEKISRCCGFPCESLASHLDVKQASAEDIKRDGKSEHERRLALLTKWSQMKGSDATYGALIDALLEIEHKKDAEEISKILRTSNKSATSCSTPVLQVSGETSNDPPG